MEDSRGRRSRKTTWQHLAALSALAVLMITVACDDGGKAADDAAGCKKDRDCKGDRICEDGECVDAPDDDEPKKKKDKTKAAKDEGDAPVAEKETEAQPGGFSKVDQSAWGPRLGPKMKAGSKVVHEVFEGPFGPSPKALFAVTQVADGSLFVLVMGDDGKGWPAGPLYEVGYKAEKVRAVAFFDADGDGTTDALVMADYGGPRGNPMVQSALLRWTDQGLRRMLKLEPKLDGVESVAEARRRLGR
jgi:hypothetical protein